MQKHKMTLIDQLEATQTVCYILVKKLFLLEWEKELTNFKRVLEKGVKKLLLLLEWCDNNVIYQNVQSMQLF